MKKREAIDQFGSAVALARALGITKQAVSQWSEEKIPEKQELRIRYVLDHSIGKRVSESE